jgi:hypothetical protein
VFPFCKLWGVEGGEAACEKAVMPNGARCAWKSASGSCDCAETNCTTVQPACTVDRHCESKCAWPCECAAGNCYTIDECSHFSDAEVRKFPLVPCVKPCVCVCVCVCACVCVCVCVCACV